MTESQSLFLVLGLVYLSECLWWVGRDVVLFRARRWGGWRLSVPGPLAGNEAGAAFVLDPLPPLGAALACQQWPLSLSPDGVSSHGVQWLRRIPRPRAEVRHLAFAEIEDTSASGKELFVNGRRFVRTASARRARELAELLHRLAGLPRDERAGAIAAALEAASDLEAIRARQAALARAARTPRLLANLTFAGFFVLFPLVAHRTGLEGSWPFLAFGLAPLWIATAVAFHRAHRALYPADTSERRARLFTMLLVPPAAIRAPADLARDALASSDPLAVAAVLCEPEAYAAFARDALRDLAAPIELAGRTQGDEARASEAWFRAELQRVLTTVARASGLDVEALLRPPAPEDGETRTYCPRCHDQFLVPVGECPDCGVALRALDRG